MKKNLLIVVVLSLSLCITGQNPVSATRPKDNNYDLGKAAVIDRVILSVLEYYYDPSRINSIRMFKSMLDVIQRAVAEVKVSYSDDEKKAILEVEKERLTLDLDGLRSPWAMSRRIHNLLEFLEKRIPHDEYDFAELEYLIAGAMLSTLDPHSNALPPDIYESLKMDTTGEFGGLGIRITTDRRPPCRGNLTVVEVFDKTPAFQAGLKVGDQIVRIDGESTVNITTSEAADRLRGKPGSTVTVHIKRRDGSIKKLDIKRDTIPIESVKWKILDENVGYISLLAFQGNSAIEFKQALEELDEKKVKGIILDLRGNPGGLLDVAIKIADDFISSGTIVTTAGRLEEEKSVRNATAENTEPLYPLVVLIDSNSASAAEIIAGALRNHGRALLVGDTTFGKGSVQMVQQLPAGGALKLTNAQYLTPGDISIQAVGVAPDVHFSPVYIDKKEMSLVPSDTRFSEANLERHLDRPSARSRNDRSGAIEATLFIPASAMKEDRAKHERCFVEDPERPSFRGRYEESFARRLIAGASGATAEELMVRASALLHKDSREQEQLVIKALKKLGVDWSDADDFMDTDKLEESKTNPLVSAKAQLIGNAVPGKKIKIKATVKNGTLKEIYRLIAVTKSDNPILDGHELVFGRLKPGVRRSWTTEIEISRAAQARIDEVQIEFSAAKGPIPEPVSVDIEVSERPKPRLVYNWQTEDLGNGNGIAEPGEELLMHLIVKNAGDGATLDAHADLAAKPGIDISQGRFDVGILAPGKTAEGVFRLKVAKQHTLDKAELSLSISEWVEARIPVTHELLAREISLPIGKKAKAPESATGSVTVKDEKTALLRENPSTAGRIVGKASSGSTFSVDAKMDGFFRVVLLKNRHAWLSDKSVTPGGKGKTSFEPFFIEPPTVSVKGPLVRRVHTEKIELKGSAEHPIGLRDLMIYVGSRKILYQPNSDHKKQLSFDAEVPLEVGPNQVVIIARHDNKVVESKIIFVRRDAPPAAPKEVSAEKSTQ